MRSFVVLVLAGLAFVVAFWLLTYDVYADVAKDYADYDEGDLSPAFCGSAYDVALVKRDGFMGGEVPNNQTEIDRQCLHEAQLDVGGAALAGLAGLALCFIGLSDRTGRSSHIARAR